MWSLARAVADDRGKKAVDATDIRILKILQADAKITNADLAERVNLSPSPCLTRVKALEQAGVIERYVALLDPGAKFFTTLLSGDRFETAVGQFPEVMECYLMTGDSDYLLRVVVSDLDALQDFIVGRLSRIEGVASIRSSIALKRVKYQTTQPLPPALGERHAGRSRPPRRRKAPLA